MLLGGRVIDNGKADQGKRLDYSIYVFAVLGFNDNANYRVWRYNSSKQLRSCVHGGFPVYLLCGVRIFSERNLEHYLGEEHKENEDKGKNECNKRVHAGQERGRRPQEQDQCVFVPFLPHEKFEGEVVGKRNHF